MLLMQASDRIEHPPIETWAPADITAHLDFMKAFSQTLLAEGEFVDAQGLAGPEEAKVVRSSPSGTPAVTDGPFPESKEFLAGFWVIDVDSLDRAIEVAAAASAAPGPGGVTLNLPIEVRQIMSAPAQDA
ncbi:MAG: YciI family protein [Actinophytocola sp.]|uniref:YciI family protein n=1 Tax=Actinophytocola sp. TaxID=1872138 RepID=UPI003C764333